MEAGLNASVRESPLPLAMRAEGRDFTAKLPSSVPEAIVKATRARSMAKSSWPELEIVSVSSQELSGTALGKERMPPLMALEAGPVTTMAGEEALFCAAAAAEARGLSQEASPRAAAARKAAGKAARSDWRRKAGDEVCMGTYLPRIVSIRRFAADRERRYEYPAKEP
jgi:hypothetical protein